MDQREKLSREILLALIVKRGWQLWQMDYDILLRNEGWSRVGSLPSLEEWEKYRAGVSPAQYIEEIRLGPWFS